MSTKFHVIRLVALAIAPAALACGAAPDPSFERSASAAPVDAAPADALDAPDAAADVVDASLAPAASRDRAPGASLRDAALVDRRSVPEAGAAPDPDASGDAPLEAASADAAAPIDASALLQAVEVAADDPTLDTVAVQLGTFAVSLHARATLEVGDAGTPTLTLAGSASRDLAAASGFVPDDAFGDVVLETRRRFSWTFSSPSDVNTVLAGTPFYLVLDAAHGAPTHFTARVVVAPRLAHLAGTRVDFERVLAPVYVASRADALAYRGSIVTRTPANGLVVTPTATLAAEGALAWRFDWTFDRLVEAAASEPTADATFGASHASARARLDARVVALGLTSADRESVWPLSSCAPAIAACLDALPAGTLDLASCGAFREVRACVVENGLP